jgi:hypothetical protein
VKIIDCKQGTLEWLQARRGIPTASQFDRILTPKTMKLSAAADDYICELIGDMLRLTPPAAEGYLSPAVQHGIETEAEARRWYSLEADADVQQVGFVLSDDGRFGCSPDGLVGDDGGLELKCPQPKHQIKYLLAGTLPDEYRAQVHGSLIVTGRAYWSFASYCPGLPPLLLRIEPDEYTARLREALDQFHTRFQAMLAKFRPQA